jgi:hypothetical protein
MTIGAALFTIAVGAVLAFAVTAEVAGIDLQIVGSILLAIGALGLVFGLWMNLPGAPRRAAARVLSAKARWVSGAHLRGCVARRAA